MAPHPAQPVGRFALAAEEHFEKTDDLTSDEFTAGSLDDELLDLLLAGRLRRSFLHT
jgi:hypothetical protein